MMQYNEAAPEGAQTVTTIGEDVQKAVIGAAADLASSTARVEAVSTINSIFSFQASAQRAFAQPARSSNWLGPEQPAAVRTPSPAAGSSNEPPPEPNRSCVVILPLTTKVLALLDEIRSGEPITLEELSRKLMETFPELVLKGTGFIEEVSPTGSTFYQCISQYMETCSHLPVSESHLIFAAAG